MAGRPGCTDVRWVVPGLLALLASLSLPSVTAAAHADVVINEYQSDNGSTVADAAGDYADWIELYNTGAQAVSLAGCGLSDDAAEPFQWVFPAVTIDPGAILLVWASDKDSTDPAGALHTNFKISAGGETLHLTLPDGSTTSEAPAQALAEDQSYGRSSDGGTNWTIFTSPTPGALNQPPAAATVAINEVMASNTWAHADGTGEYPDWIELHNTTGASVSLAGWGLSDDADDPLQWTFPAVEIEAGGYLIVWASGDETAGVAGELHAGFKIGADGESVFLTRPDLTRVDASPPAAMPSDVSYGRAPDGSATWRYFSPATPGGPNDATGYEGVLEPPELSRDAGYSSGPFDLTIAAAESTDVRYTTDGSVPSESSSAYAGAIPIVDRAGPAAGPTLIRTTTQGYPWHPPEGDVFRGTVVRARAFREGWLPSATTTATYFVTPSGASRYSMPVVSLSTDPHGLFDPEDGVYVPGPGSAASTAGFTPEANFHRRGSEWELPTHVEFFEQDGSIAIDQDAGVRIQGNWAREYHQKSFRVHARSRYGDDDFDCRLFPDREPDSYSSFLLRTASSDVRWGMIRDAMIQELSGHLGFDTQACRPVIVFLNGDYWGIHFLRERYDEDYLAGRYDVDPDEVDLIEIDGDPEVDAGDADHYDAMVSYMQANSLAGQAAYDHVRTLMDVENFTRYYAAEIIAANTDWPHKNVRLWRRRTLTYEPGEPAELDGRWRWMMFDTERGFSLRESSQPSNNTVEWAAGTFMLGRLLQNPTFRVGFINELADQSNTAFRPSRALHVIDSLAAQIEPEMPEHIARWGEPVSMAFWRSELQKMGTFAITRPGYLCNHIMAQFGLTGAAAVTLDVEGTESSGVVSINGMPITGATPGATEPVYPWTGTYFRFIPIQLVATPAPGHTFGGWEGVPSDVAFDDTISVIPIGPTAITAWFDSSPTSVAESERPLTLSLEQNAPNPFNPSTTIRFRLPEQGHVRVDLYATNGQRVRSLVDARLAAGSHSVSWDGSDDAGRAVGSGVYLCRLHTDGVSLLRRLTLVR